MYNIYVFRCEPSRLLFIFISMGLLVFYICGIRVSQSLTLAHTRIYIHTLVELAS